MRTQNPKVKLKDDYKNKAYEDKEEVEQVYLTKNDMFFAFIDVLGFKQSFNEKREDGEKIKDIDFAEKYKKIFGYYFQLLNASELISRKSTSECDECYAGQTSDTLYFYSQREDLLIEYIKIFLNLNLYAISQNVFFRGGIAKGNLFIKEPYQFYGESVIYAYLLECGVAKDPIVMVDEDTYKAVINTKGTNCLFKERGKRHYLNILAPFEKEFNFELCEGMASIGQIPTLPEVEKNIKKNLGRFEYDEKNYGKYYFLANEIDNYIENLK